MRALYIGHSKLSEIIFTGKKKKRKKSVETRTQKRILSCLTSTSVKSELASNFIT